MKNIKDMTLLYLVPLFITYLVWCHRTRLSQVHYKNVEKVVEYYFTGVLISP